jgi:hypothetical protein
MQEMSGYAVKGWNSCSYLTYNADQTVFVVATIGVTQGKRIAFADLIVRLLGDKIVIEEDRNNKMLVDALVSAGVPRGQIILAYAGEALEETADAL